ncbi:MAG: hypothetical protein JSR85_08730 [Proteobacteria bacterium]|nr:hypothetical protein [Pseudomonadota bacterium]
MKMLLTILALSVFFIPVFASYSDVQADQKGRGTTGYQQDTNDYSLYPKPFYEK